MKAVTFRTETQRRDWNVKREGADHFHRQAAEGEVMSRSGYVDDCDDDLMFGRWRAQVNNAIRGKRGQAFLKELAAAMDAMPEKILISDELIDEEGNCCAIGVVCKARGVDVSRVDYDDPDAVGNAVGIARQMAAEIEYHNDEYDDGHETPEHRWQRMRKWVESKIRK